MRTPHLVAGALAVSLLGVGAAAFSAFAFFFEDKYVHAVAGVEHTELNNGNVLEQVALRQEDLLPIYGASELVLLETEYQANRFFSTYPTGFMVFNIASKGGSSLTTAQKLAALGEDLRGRKVVISIGPAIMTMAPYGEVNVRHYNGNFSPLNALELAFSPHLSMDTKSRIARRMLDFPEPLEKHPFIRFTLENLADLSPLRRLAYQASQPLGWIQISILRLQDHYNTVNFIRHLSSGQTTITRKDREIDWESLVPIAEKEQIENTDSNLYGVDNSQWPKIKELFLNPVPPGSKDKEFREDVENAREWHDLDLALRVIRELDAEAMIMSSPMNVPLWETIGVSQEAQQAYYDKLHSVVAPYDLPVIDFRQFDSEPYFSMDLASHASRKGWIYVNQALDGIFHGDLP
ncbi:MAG: D-alanyl-lipoteichoic acid biosynthesis protein DltD [Chloroflexi bacterium]|nr:D-alanyl-lipoteichoic acid biosynthesis protein DltD [Chloroflexota bacterium]